MAPTIDAQQTVADQQTLALPVPFRAHRLHIDTLEWDDQNENFNSIF